MGFTETTHRPFRPTWPAILNGMKGRCPNCGQGKLFRGYLKVADTCDQCGTELFHQRADDAPPYIVITIVGHIAVGALLHMELTHALHPLVYLWTMIPLIIIASLVLLPITKGAIVGLQWARYMHGFDPAGTGDETDEEDWG